MGQGQYLHRPLTIERNLFLTLTSGDSYATQSEGGLKDGQGTVSSGSGILSNTKYSFTTRFEDAPGTNPEELIAVAHAACFSMALSAQLGGANLTPESINTSATLTMEKLEAGWAITAVHLDVVG